MVELIMFIQYHLCTSPKECYLYDAQSYSPSSVPNFSFRVLFQLGCQTHKTAILYLYLCCCSINVTGRQIMMKVKCINAQCIVIIAIKKHKKKKKVLTVYNGVNFSYDSKPWSNQDLAVKINSQTVKK